MRFFLIFDPKKFLKLVSWLTDHHHLVEIFVRPCVRQQSVKTSSSPKLLVQSSPNFISDISWGSRTKFVHKNFLTPWGLS